MAKRNGKNILPDDIMLFHILPRLPNKSLGRFMCVCKQWDSFLTTHTFTKMHLQYVNNQNHHKMLVVSTRNSCNNFQTMDCETPELGLSANRSLPFEVNNNNMTIISSLNGLVCVGIQKPRAIDYEYLDVILWNPLTGDYKNISRGNYFTFPPRGYGLYYSSCDDDYKLLCITQSNDAYIYSWKSESWRKAKSRADSLLEIWGFSCLVDEKLYFIAYGTQGSSIRDRSHLIIKFDTKTELFTKIGTPFSIFYHMTVLSGCIHVCVVPKGDRDKLELWKMDGDGEWTKVVRSCKFLYRYQLWHLMKNGNWLMYSFLRRKGYVYKVDLEMHRKPEKVCQYTSTIDRSMNTLLRTTFVETIVSLKR